jgi:hypothetical protein
MPTGQRKFAREDGKYADFLDTNSGNLKPDGTAFIGSSSLAAPSDHIHPGTVAALTAKAYAQAGSILDMGYVGASGNFLTISPLVAPTASTWTAGVFFLARICCFPSTPVNGYVSTTWLNHASMVNSYIALYNSAGVQIGVTADLSASASYYLRAACTGFTVTPADGIIYAGYLNGTSGVAGGPYYMASPWNSNYLSDTQTPPLTSAYNNLWPGLSYSAGLSTAPSTVTYSSAGGPRSSLPLIFLD